MPVPHPAGANDESLPRQPSYLNVSSIQKRSAQAPKSRPTRWVGYWRCFCLLARYPGWLLCSSMAYVAGQIGLTGGFTLTLDGVSKAYGRRRICLDVSLELKIGDRLAVVGPNGSGKTTFLKLLCGLLRPDHGVIHYTNDGVAEDRLTWYRFVGLVAPDLALYDELTALENLRFLSRVGGWPKADAELRSLLVEVGLEEREHDLVVTFSSGMKQRLKYAAALVKNPPLLLLDEPTANLDEAGVAMFGRMINTYRSRGICVMATNDPKEAELAERQIVMGR